MNIYKRVATSKGFYVKANGSGSHRLGVEVGRSLMGYMQGGSVDFGKTMRQVTRSIRQILENASEAMQSAETQMPKLYQQLKSTEGSLFVFKDIDIEVLKNQNYNPNVADRVVSAWSALSDFNAYLTPLINALEQYETQVKALTDAVYQIDL